VASFLVDESLPRAVATPGSPLPRDRGPTCMPRGSPMRTVRRAPARGCGNLAAPDATWLLGQVGQPAATSDLNRCPGKDPWVGLATETPHREPLRR
jgi:hypothetical protein